MTASSRQPTEIAPPDRVHGSRRQCLRVAACLPAAAALAGLGACQGATGADRLLAFASLSQAEVELLRLSSSAALRSTAVWTWAQTLVHGAQSIEYSMLGFPASKSALFQSTVGQAAFKVFDWRGRMTHDRGEPIPGAPAWDPGLEPAGALARLRAAIAAFEHWSGPLRPHFAYGELDKPAYERAHAMHLADHLAQFHAAT